MPTGKLENKKEKTTLVFDTWARIEADDQELFITWSDVDLADAERSMLRDLVERPNYLGRWESWVEGRLVEDGETIPEANCLPEKQGEVVDRHWKQVALIAPDSAEAYNTWRAERLDGELAHLPLPEGKRPTKKLLKDRQKIQEIYPEGLVDCLQKDTTWLRSYGWSRPPGSRRVLYWRRSGAISTSPRQAKAVAQPEQRVQAMLLSLSNTSRNDHALPPLTRTLPQAELLHRSLVFIAAKMAGKVPQELTGRDERGKPLKGAHDHIHINPLDLDGDGHLDHRLLWATRGFETKAQAAIRAARKLSTNEGVEPLRLALAATGDFQDLASLVDEYGQPQGQAIARLTEPASHWQSVTPFVPPRHMKARGKNSLEGQIRTELSTRGFPEPVPVTILATLTQQQSVAPEPGANAENFAATCRYFRHFKLSRTRGPRPPVICGFALRLEFPHPVSGPIALGYGSHFGLGLLEGCGGG